MNEKPTEITKGKSKESCTADLAHHLLCKASALAS
jgi:hypothetical protein